MTMIKPEESIPFRPADYQHIRAHGSWLLRLCALCGRELEYLGETASEAHAREATEEPWSSGDGADCTPTHKRENRDRRLDEDDHDRCQCEGRAC